MKLKILRQRDRETSQADFMKTIFITGANRGIGLELTRQLSSTGNQIIATCRNPEEAVELLELSRDSHRNIEILPMDVEQEESVTKLAETLRNRGEKINLLFNNAGIIDWRSMQDIDTK
jgi:NAD(P)-dependent dehydrogenase (short-subunit alcohol dehydrogenase family)